ncbi:flagellar export protein FliJ [Aquibacillus sp. 3ASR75-11]|uniref:Flagellar FliJ protein n=1 Tax=Terrihalobacillus insolitus TaxID=2950438 RepID=A0A9X4AKR2_9BACI|nr:flagellar export protein FliJ [Terrihalobacillus insolitus]MDC3414136.1 flagellar export protein FliJ [Terrihalobacillus insolitus]MDC3423577.1 flagellar export protein FliJ [Terrihalobacillus insolitus]
MATSSYTKILQVREHEKTDAYKMYKKAVDSFEEIGMELFHLLKKKEEAEREYHSTLSGSAPIATITFQHSYLERLKHQIEHVQIAVNNARAEMEKQQGKLTNAHMEVKKMEQLIHNDFIVYHQKLTKQENEQMDEISIRQYVNGNR